MIVRIAILIPKNYWILPSSTGNGSSHRAIPSIVEGLERAGAVAELVQPGQQLPEVQGLLLPGGADIHPAFYGQSVDQAFDLDPGFDRFQLHHTRQALARELPVLGICRGLQVLNVAAGGTLHQHVEQHTFQRVEDDPGLRGEGVHRLEAREELRRLLGSRPRVNSIHHQAVDRLGAGFEVTAWSDDQTVESIQSQGRAWQMGVQFHPEDMPELQNLFDRFVEAAR